MSGDAFLDHSVLDLVLMLTFAAAVHIPVNQVLVGGA